jgi:hypothetical protein
LCFVPYQRLLTFEVVGVFSRNTSQVHKRI